MIDVFFRTYPSTKNPMRFALGSVVSFRLGMMENIDAFILSPTAGHPKDIKVPHPFHVNSKKMAEDLAVSFIYCVMDDDQLPIADDFFEVGRATLDAHPEYGMLAGFPLEYGLHGQPYAHRTEDVIEAHSIGCPYFVRRGTLTFPDGELRQYDGILSKVVTDQGLKTGFARKCVYNHLGYGFSQIGYTD